MTTLFPKKKLIKSLLILLAIALPTYAIAAEDNYRSELVNQTKQASSDGFRLVRTRQWPGTGCLIDTGKQIVNPGESTDLVIKNSKECNDSGVGYEIYKMGDTKNEHLLGYLSHRLGDGKFSLQISRFCEGNKCVFTDLNPTQNRSRV